VKRIALWTVLSSAFVTLVTFIALSASGQQTPAHQPLMPDLSASGQTPPPRPLTPEQMQLVAQKEAARRAAGIPADPTGPGQFAGPVRSARPFTGQVWMTKAQLLADFTAAEAHEQAYIARLEQEAGPSAALRAREAREQRRREIEALTDGPIELAIPAVEAQ
jgi:hypothetical protein